MNDFLAKTIDEFVYQLGIWDTILYPTDTIWWIGGDATSYDLINKVALIKHTSLFTKKWFVALVYPNFVEEYTRYSASDILDRYNKVDYILILEIKRARNLPVNLNIDWLCCTKTIFLDAITWCKF